MKKTALILCALTCTLVLGSCGGDSSGCPSSQTSCGGLCVSTDSDPDHCGECDNACADGEVCVDGACADSCPSGSTNCGGVCVDTDADRNHCGECDNECPDGEVCADGACADSCPDTQTLCGDVCVDLLRNTLHCGECDNACAAGELCSSGTCTLSCGGDTPTRCGDSCVDTDTNPLHCGECDNACDPGQVCNSGTCEGGGCPTGQIVCDGECVNPDDDPDFCGATGDCTGENAGAVCTDDESCVDGECLPLDPCATHTASGTPGVTLGTPSGTAVEGEGAVTYTVVLDTAPCAPVVIAVAPDAEATVVPSTLVFLPDTWDVTQTVSVTAVHDFDIEGDHTSTVGHTPTSLDPDYGSITIGDATIDITDRNHLEHVSVPLAGTGSNGGSVAWSVSNDGRYVAFESAASNLIFGDSGSFSDVFVRDMTTGVTTRITNGLAGEADGDSSKVAMSNDGDRIAFFSRAINLVSDSITTAGEVYLYTQSTGITSLISGQCTACNTEIASTTVALSGDGAFAAYTTRRMLLTSDTESEYDVYVHEIATGTVTHDSLNSSDGNGTSFWGSNAFSPTLSATGQFMGFNSAAQNLDTPEITVENFHPYVKDRTGRALDRVTKHNGGDTTCEGTHHATSSGPAYISSSGNLAVFYSECAHTLGSGEPADANGFSDVFMRNISAETTTRLSLTSTGTESDGNSYPIAISDDAQYVLFRSDATNLVPGDTNGATDLFIRDTVGGTTTRVSLDQSYGEIAGGVETVAWMSRNGSWVAFATITNLLSSDGNTDVIDVYLLQLR